MSFKLCINPFDKNDHPRNAIGIRKITADQQKKLEELKFKLVSENDLICNACRLKLNKMESPESSSERSTTSQEKSEESDFDPVTKASEITIASGQSPIDKRKLGNEAYGVHKIRKLVSTVSSAIGIPAPIVSTTSEMNRDLADDWLTNLKIAYQNETKRSQKIFLLTTLPDSWNRSRIEQEFQVSSYTSKQVKDLVAAKGHYSYPEPIKGKPLPDSVRSKVINFYYEMDVSRELPGIKDKVSVREGGIKVQKTKRLMLLNLREAYSRFKIENNDQIGFSKFAMLRPKECILPGSSGTHSVCVCIIHQNAYLMYSAVSSFMEDKSINDVLIKIVCNVDNYDCCSEICNVCSGNISQFISTIADKLEAEEIEEIRYHCWSGQDRCRLQEIVQQTGEFLDALKELLKKLKLHSFIAKQQHEYLRSKKNNLKQGEYLIICDFAENYSFITQEEVQSSHWDNQQATIFPMVIYYMDNDELKSSSHAMISEELKHLTSNVYHFQHQLIQLLKDNAQNYPTPTKIIYFSDGSAAQFKNKKNFINICFHNEDFNIDAEWNFFATAHGKGPADGVGGTVKRLARIESLRTFNRARFANAEELFIWAKENIKGINFSYSSKEDHRNTAEILSDRFKNLRLVPGTQSYHHFIPSPNDKNSILCKKISNFVEEYKQHNLK